MILGLAMDSPVGSRSDLCSGSNFEVGFGSATGSSSAIDSDSGSATEECFLPTTSRSTANNSQ